MGSGGSFSPFGRGGDGPHRLLRSEDAKTRKNAALLMGDLRNPSFFGAIWKAYQEDGQRFVKSSYLSAIGNLITGSIWTP